MCRLSFTLASPIGSSLLLRSSDPSPAWAMRSCHSVTQHSPFLFSASASCHSLCRLSRPAHWAGENGIGNGNGNLLHRWHGVFLGSSTKQLTILAMATVSISEPDRPCFNFPACGVLPVVSAQLLTVVGLALTSHDDVWLVSRRFTAMVRVGSRQL